MTIETRIPPGSRGVDLFLWSDMSILGPADIEVTVWNTETAPVDEFGVRSPGRSM